MQALRARRNFQAELYLSEKPRMLNQYLREAGLSSCVLGVSGGLDSALVLALALRASREPGSPLQRVLPVLLPVQERGASGQQEASQRGAELCHALGVEPLLIPLARAHLALAESVEQAIGQTGGDWARGQLVSYARTPALYYLTSLLTEAGSPGLLLGTTNRDEGAYLGFVGKASDGMVDLQLIADLHKSEVRQLSRALGLPPQHPGGGSQRRYVRRAPG